MATLLAIDGSSVFMRAMSVLPEDKRTADDLEYMTVSMIRRAARVTRADYLVVALDTTDQCWRYNIHPEYKGDRKYSDLRPKQLTPILLPRLSERGIATSYNKDMEADDLLCTLSFTLKHQSGHRMLVYTRDTDLLPLTCFPNVSLLWPEKGGELKVMERAACTDRLGYDPSWLPAMRALTADQKDNLRALLGVPKGWRCPITQKRGIEMLTSAEGSFLAVMENAVEGKAEGLKEQEVEHLCIHAREIASMYHIAQLSRNAELSVDASKTNVRGMDLTTPLRED